MCTLVRDGVNVLDQEPDLWQAYRDQGHETQQRRHTPGQFPDEC